MEEYEYLENLNSEELAKIIDQMLDFEETTKDMIDVVDKRKEEIGKILLDEIIIDLTKNKVAISKDFLEKLRRTYAAIDNKMNMRCKYEEFLEYGENEK